MATLVASKHYNLLYEGQRAHQWKPDRKVLMGVTDWVGKTVGVAGYGSIGRQGECAPCFPTS
jgi:phosphoglycerate dehydrogenase-like enzyme